MYTIDDFINEGISLANIPDEDDEEDEDEIELEMLPEPNYKFVDISNANMRLMFLQQIIHIDKMYRDMEMYV